MFSLAPPFAHSLVVPSLVALPQFACPLYHVFCSFARCQTSSWLAEYSWKASWQNDVIVYFIHLTCNARSSWPKNRNVFTSAKQFDLASRARFLNERHRGNHRTEGWRSSKGVGGCGVSLLNHRTEGWRSAMGWALRRLRPSETNSTRRLAFSRQQTKPSTNKRVCPKQSLCSHCRSGRPCAQRPASRCSA